MSNQIDQQSITMAILTEWNEMHNVWSFIPVVLLVCDTRMCLSLYLTDSKPERKLKAHSCITEVDLKHDTQSSKKIEKLKRC